MRRFTFATKRDAVNYALRALASEPLRARLIPTQPSDWLDAARMYRAGRREGVTVHKLVDCLIAAIAVRSDEPVLHHEADFDAIARVSGLEVVRA